MRKNYNYERIKLLLPEYGRHIQDMVAYLCTIEDREERNFQARTVIAAMGNLNPILRDTPEYAHKLWDHLFILSDFSIDIDSPYPIPTAATLAPVPTPLAYPRRRIARKQYGANIPRIIKAMDKCGDSAQVRAAINDIARYMRAKSFEYNQDHPNNDVIIKEIKGMASGNLAIDEQSISNMRSDYKPAHSAHAKKGQYQQNRNGKQNKGKNGKPQRRGRTTD